MSTFTTRSDGRIHVHILPHTRFRTKDLMIRLHTPLVRDTVTAMSLLPYMWMNGTKTHPSTRDLQIAADDLYGSVIRTSLGKRAGYHVFEAAASIPDVSRLTADDVVAQAADLVCQVLLDHAAGHGAFSDEAVAQEIDLHRRRIEAARDDKMGFALQRCMAEVAEDSPAALPRLGFIDELGDLTSDKLYRTYESVFQASEVHAYLVGPFENAHALAEKLIRELGRVFPSDSSRTAFRVEPLSREARAEFQTVTEHQDVAQAQLDMGYRTGVNFADENYPSLLMMNGVFGGFAHSKLFLNVREKHSLAYSVWSHHDGMTGALAVMTGIDPKNYDQARQIIDQQLSAIQAGDVSDEEINFTFRGLQNQYTVLLDQPAALANWHYNGVLSGKERDIEDMLKALQSVTKEDIVQAAQAVQPHTIYFLTGEGDAS
ncbi:EF-P 5-aminopentanol modification-associated protein YfmF [Alicyclobacillus dauci]|uniref:Insulinase family protein n=1 Tax=Alicyclobacillus dauci TaxID=1475485 RepID=A0ABY6Z0J7_9BACL|nr:pitrilysin family protein [Alicyclobacillus dauci]WAH35756.1 insulinase family protein [Alicyclobacillus dauci]